MNLSSRMAKIGAIGGRKSKREITPAQQKKLVAARKRKSRLRKKFSNLKEEWRKETRLMSDTYRMSRNRHYRGIIEMGMDVVPIILEDLRVEPDHWFYALQKITNENPVSPSIQGHIKAMCSAWIKWGEDKRLIKKK